MKCYGVKLGYGKVTQWGRSCLRWHTNPPSMKLKSAAEAAVTACHDDTICKGVRMQSSQEQRTS